MTDPVWSRHFAQWVENQWKRLDDGVHEYGDESFDKPLSELAEEIEQEIIDQANWSYILFCRIQRTKSKIRSLEGRLAGAS